MTTTVEVLADAFQQTGTPFSSATRVARRRADGCRAQRDMRFILMKQETAGAMLAATWGEITGCAGRLPLDPWSGRHEHGQRSRHAS